MSTLSDYGYWPSLVTPSLLTQQGIRYSNPTLADGSLFWTETRPAEAGRSALLCKDGSGIKELLPSISVRSRIQEYGGNAYCVAPNTLYYVDDKDQRIYACLREDADNSSCNATPITPEGAYRYSDFYWDAHRQQLLAVCEDATLSDQHPTARIIAINPKSGEHLCLAQGADFYSNPRISPDGSQFSYLRWSHPSMPWDETECVVSHIDAQNQLSHTRVLGGHGESLFQPQWSPSNTLYVVSDRSNWWNIYRVDDNDLTPILSMAAEFATPQWVFGMSTYGFLDEDTIFATYTQHGRWSLGQIDIASSTLTPIESSLCDISSVHCEKGQALFIGASPTTTPQIWHYDGHTINSVTRTTTGLPDSAIACAHAISFPTRDGETAHGFFYAPTTLENLSPAGLPPLLVMCHGGPTGATETSLNLKIQFWTSRGYAVLDVNYRGSTGYGRAYRQRLNGQWGVLDVIDACSGVDYLAERTLIDPHRVGIRGSSAGGFTVLAALTFTDTFHVGASLYGIGDLAALVRDSHKFEAHYLDGLVGTYPEEDEIYRARSPIHHVDQLNCPVIFLQGLKDKVVLPSQAEAMVNALQKKGIPTHYVTFENEGHGFRQAETIERALMEELAFYQQHL